jgi:hypothetical protein
VFDFHQHLQVQDRGKQNRLSRWAKIATILGLPIAALSLLIAGPP